MRVSMIAVASALALFAGGALAQSNTTPSGGMTATPGTTAPKSTAPGSTAGAPAATPRAPAPDPMTMEDVSQIKGSSVYGSDDKKIGDVSTVLMKPGTKTIDRLVVSSGGVLGIGGRQVALPVDEFKWDGQKDGFKISKTEDQLKQMPEWKSASSGSAPSSGSGSSTAPATATSHAAPPSTGGSAAPTKTQ
ncbi:MAG TPA: PRC-barrel domain-containing protein [Stellaceae bacterium]|nr:PRC-barrel domain-containing protein [Stellaceae bacterium]